MEIWACEGCQFLWNAAFDPRHVSYDETYEATQIHSALFRIYLSEMAREWLAGLSGPAPVILEVGCGQGEFLALLREQTDATLVGFDPAFRADARDGVEITASNLPDEPDQKADLVINRMTLEHVAEPAVFLARMRKWLKPEGRLITQVPNASRMLKDSLVCDLFYEHVNYFTEASLGSALRAAGYGNISFETDYDDQHLTAIAQIGPQSAVSHVEVPDTTRSLEIALAEFAQLWDGILAEQSKQGRAIWLWGTGSRATTFMAMLNSPQRIEGAIDINPNRAGSYVLGTRCKTSLPNILAGQGPIAVVVMNPIYADEIQAVLNDLNVDARMLRLRAVPI